jgi:hypothetical protein
MRTQRPSDRKVLPFGVAAPPEDPLEFRVELWSQGAEKPERVIGRAADIGPARAMFAAARTEFVGKRITLSRGDRLLQSTD